jgi:hypothetical protein
MNRKGTAPMGTVFSSDTARGRWAVDELLEGYVSWREECDGVRLAYQRWVDATRAEGRLAYAGYVAALDREERAARAYANHIERFGWISE